MSKIMEHPQKVNPKDLEKKVKEMYKKVAQEPQFGYHFKMGRGNAVELGYPSELLDEIPSDAIESFAGVGYYFDMAKLQTGECVVDLGSGSGMDSFFAANKVGPEGEVIGIEMTPEQLEKSRNIQKQFGFNQVYFKESYIEQLPIVSNSIDAIISNGVINLSSQKGKVFKEAARVLKPGGRLAISDIVTTKNLPIHITANADLWAACIGGAVPEHKYIGLIEAAGFEIDSIKDNPYSFISESAINATRMFGISSLSILAIKKDNS